MGKIVVLDELTASQIAAGEVIERPASVVKETVENSIDAKATSITVEIKDGGIKYIRVIDNGNGFEPDDAVIAFDKHATSKICCGEDLAEIHTLGFRGEALASIASVADVELLSRTSDNKDGIFVKIRGGALIENGPRSCSKGTSITVRDLFYNTPARYKFLKRDQTEASYISDIIQKLALAHPEISFRLISSGKEILRTPGNGDLLSCIYSIYGKGITESLIKVNCEDTGISLTGFTGIKDAIYGTRSRQMFFVNNRFIKSKILSSALDEAYKTVTMKGKFPFALLNIQINPANIDVNVHPTKSEVRFADESTVYRCVYHAVNNALLNPGEDKPYTLPPQKQSIQEPLKDFFNTTKEVAREQKNLDLPPINTYSPKVAESSQEYNDLPPIPPMPPVPPAPPVPVREEVYPTVAPLPLEKAADDKEPTFATYNDRSVFTDSTVIGQIFDSYIVLTKEDMVIFVDQHAAHERIMYERIKESIKNAKPESQLLLFPQTVNLSSSEYILLEKNMDFFTSMGFEIEPFGDNTVKIRAVPMAFMEGDPEAIIVDGLSDLQKSTGLYTDRALYTMACKAAIKANKKLSLQEIQDLLATLAQLDNPSTCPHGRPVQFSMTKTEIERRFKRC